MGVLNLQSVTQTCTFQGACYIYELRPLSRTVRIHFELYYEFLRSDWSWRERESEAIVLISQIINNFAGIVNNVK